jgi:hypothetical protein
MIINNMRYLKYNEEFKKMNDPDLNQLYDDINKLANECLAYLIDDGFSVSVGKKPFTTLPVNNFLPEFFFYKKGIVLNSNQFIVEKFTWEEIKDDFIPFLEMCNDRFTVFNIKINGFGNYQVNVNDLISEKSDCPALKTNKSTLKEHKINHISFFIENK